MPRATPRPALLAAALAAACTVHEVKVPPLTGPSEFGLSISVTATPDSISQDGVSQSAIVVYARGPSGAGVNAVQMRLQVAADGVLQDFGTLSAKSVITGPDGRAATVYTAPPAPPPPANDSEHIVAVIVTPTGSNFQTAVSQAAEIRLVPIGVIQPPTQTPNPSFTFSPARASVNVPVEFDASPSCATSEPCTGTAGITSFQWNFGDGTTAAGIVVTKAFSVPSSYPVTLTVTNDRRISASTTQQVAVETSDAPTAQFEFWPPRPVIGTEVQFDASLSTAAPGRRITRYIWNWDDGDAPVTGRLQDHDFQSAGTFAVTLTVTDDAGQSAAISKDVTVGSGKLAESSRSTGRAAARFGPIAARFVGGANIATRTFDSDPAAAGSHTLAGPVPHREVHRYRLPEPYWYYHRARYQGAEADGA